MLASTSWLAGLVFAVLGAANPRPSVAAGLHPEALAGTGSSLQWKAAQFIQADAKGRVYLLRGDSLDVYQVTGAGTLGDPQKLETPPAAGGGGPVQAAMAPSGAWLVLRGLTAPPLLLRAGRSDPLASIPWMADAIGMSRDTPVVNVLPQWIGHRPADYRVSDPPPLLLTHEGGKWSVLVSEEVPAKKTGEDEFMTSLLHRGSTLAGTPAGKLWVARRYGYRIRLLSAAGRPLLALTSGKDEPTQIEDPEAARTRLAREATRQGFRPDKGGGLQAITAEEVIRALAPDRDGKLYLLVKTAQGFALDRIDPVEQTLMRVPLRLQQAANVRSMAAGKDGLYFATYRGDGGRYWLAWSDVEAAPWHAVPGARFGRR